MRLSYEGDREEALNWLGIGEQQVFRARLLMNALGLTAHRYRVNLSPDVQAFVTIIPGYEMLHIVTNPSAANDEPPLLYFEFATSAYPVQTVLNDGEASYKGCVVGVDLSLGSETSLTLEPRLNGKRAANLRPLSKVRRLFQEQLINEPVAYIEPAPGGSYDTTVYATYAPYNPYTGIYVTSVNYEAPRIQATESGCEFAFSSRDTGFDVPFGFSKDNQPVKLAVLRGEADWPRATSIQNVGGKFFAVYIDAFAVLHVFPLSAINSPLGEEFEQNVDQDAVQSFPIPLPEWAFVPPAKAMDQADDRNRWFSHSPDISWCFNHLGTKACAVLHERESAEWDSAYLTDPDTRFTLSADKSSWIGRTGTQQRFWGGAPESSVEDIYTYGRGVFEIGIEITPGTDADFSVAITTNEIRTPRDSDRGTYMAGYSWQAIEDKDIEAGDMLLLDIERWYEPAPFVSPTDHAEWRLSFHSAIHGVVYDFAAMSGTVNDWLQQFCTLVVWDDNPVASKWVVWAPDNPPVVFGGHGAGRELTWLYYQPEGFAGTIYAPAPQTFASAMIITPANSAEICRACWTDSFVSGRSLSFFSLRRIRDGEAAEVAAANGDALTAIDLKTASFVVSIDVETTVDRTVNLNEDFVAPASYYPAGTTFQPTATMPHRISHPGAAVYVRGSLVDVLTPNGASDAVNDAITEKANRDVRADTSSWTYMAANDFSDWSGRSDLRDVQLYLNGATTDFPARLPIGPADTDTPLSRITVEQRNWWLAMCVNSGNLPLLLVTNPNFGWALYTSEVVQRTQNTNTTFFVHPNGSWAYYDATRIYNTYGVPDLFSRWEVADLGTYSGRQGFGPQAFPYPYATDHLEAIDGSVVNPGLDLAALGEVGDVHYVSLTVEGYVAQSPALLQMGKYAFDGVGPVATYADNSLLDAVLGSTIDPTHATHVHKPAVINVWNDYDTIATVPVDEFKHQIFDRIHLQVESGGTTHQKDTTFADQYRASVPDTSTEILAATDARLRASFSLTPSDRAIALVATWGGSSLTISDYAFKRISKPTRDGIYNPGDLAGPVGTLLKPRFTNPGDGHRWDGMPPTFSTCLLLGVERH